MGFTGFRTATIEELPDAVAVMDSFQVASWPAMPSIAAGYLHGISGSGSV